MKILDVLKKYKPVSRGLYSGRIETDKEKFRVHLRIEKSGDGLLSLNAQRILHLNGTAAEIAYHFIRGLKEEETITLMRKRYRASRETVKKDVDNLFQVINILSRTDKACPLTDLGIYLEEPYTREVSAPLRMDIALTYRCRNKCGHCYNDPNRKVDELEKDDWFKVLKKCEEAGIPHVVFTGGEPTLIEFLPELVAYAEELGLITGLNTNGRNLRDAGYAKKLFEAGLDHVQVTLESPDKEIHDRMSGALGAFAETLEGLGNSLKTGIFTMTNTTITKANKESVKKMPEFLKKTGIPTFAVNSIIFSGKATTSNSHLTKQELIPLLEGLAKSARENDLKFIWYTPTKYCELNPIELGLGVKQCTAARLGMAIEPNGDVIPCQSYYKSVGNILRDGWETIWNNELCKKLRMPRKPLKECETCADLTLCGGGCPLENEQEFFSCREINSGG